MTRDLLTKKSILYKTKNRWFLLEEKVEKRINVIYLYILIGSNTVIKNCSF